MQAEEQKAVSVTTKQIEEATQFVLVTPPQAVAVRLAQYQEQVRVYRHLLESRIQRELVDDTHKQFAQARASMGSSIAEALECILEDSPRSRQQAAALLESLVVRFFPEQVTED